MKAARITPIPVWLLMWLLMWLLWGCATTPTPDPLSRAPAESDMERYIVVTLRNQAGPAVPRAGSTVRTYDMASAYAVGPATRADATAIASAHGLREVSAWPIGLLGVHCIVFELPPGSNRSEMLAQLRRDRRVESAQAMHSFGTLSTSSNDPYRGLQRNLDVMNVSGAHHWSRGEGVRIAIIDTGVDAAHPDLVDRIVKQENFVDDGSGRDHRDRHGTAVAGVIAAVGNNQEGIIGVAPAARLHALRGCWPAARDPTRALCSTLTLAKALVAAIEARVQIVNLSLTGPADPLLARVIEAGLKRGIIFVGAQATTAGAANFPANIEGVISVAASGASSSADSALFAPGSEVLTLVPDGRYDFVSGSSVAAASISGGIALLLARDRKLRAADARAILIRSSRSIATNEGSVASVNLCAALAEVVDGGSCGLVEPQSDG